MSTNVGFCFIWRYVIDVKFHSNSQHSILFIIFKIKKNSDAVVHECKVHTNSLQYLNMVYIESIEMWTFRIDVA